MTLHEAIVEVLRKKKKALPALQIAEDINTLKLYKRKDGLPVTSTQVLSRVANYNHLFIKKGNRIALRFYNELDVELEEITDEYRKLINKLWSSFPLINTHDELEVVLELILVGLIEFDNSPSRDLAQIRNGMLEIINNYSMEFGILRASDAPNKNYIITELVPLLDKVYNFSDRIKVVQKLIYLTFESSNRGRKGQILPQYIGEILGGLKIYNNDSTIHLTNNILSNFVLPIYEKNKGVHLGLKNLTLWRNESMFRLNKLVLDACHLDSTNVHSKKVNQIAIIAPPWNTRNKYEKWSSNFSALSDSYESFDQPELNKAILIVPEGATFNGGRDYHARKWITEQRDVDAVFTIPFKSDYSGIKSIALVFIDFNKKEDKILMADFTLDEKFDIVNDWNQIPELYNKQNIIKGLSKVVTFDEISKFDFEWSPKRYVDFIEKFQESNEFKADHQVFKLKDLLLNWRKGRKVDRKSLYEGGEIKFLRITDLNPDDIYFKPGQHTLGLDFDQLTRPISISENIIITSLVGKKLKVGIIPNEESYLFDGNLSVLEVDSSKVLPEFLAKELKEDYIQKRYSYVTKGTTIPYVSLKDFVEIEVQIPSIEIQKDILINKNRISNLIASNIYASTNEMNLPNVDNVNLIGNSVLKNYLGIIKHTMKQPLATLSEDITNIAGYLNRKSEEGVLNLNEFIEPLLPGESEDDNSESQLNKVIERLDRAIKDAHWRFEQSENLLKIETSKEQLKKVNIKEYLKTEMSKYTDIESKIKGESSLSLIDENLFSILIDNLVDNARKYGFANSTDKRIMFQIKNYISNDGVDKIKIDYFNSGEALPLDFRVENFISNGHTTNQNVGEGFGGYLINSILKKHGGSIDIIKDVENNLEYNVHFVITLKGI